MNLFRCSMKLEFKSTGIFNYSFNNKRLDFQKIDEFYSNRIECIQYSSMVFLSIKIMIFYCDVAFNASGIVFKESTAKLVETAITLLFIDMENVVVIHLNCFGNIDFLASADEFKRKFQLLRTFL